jgi:hypothetical protein
VRSKTEKDHRLHPSRAIRRGYRAALALVVGAGLVVAAVPLSAAAATTQSLFPAAVTPAVSADPDTVAVQLGVRFSSAVGGQVTAVKFYKSSQNTGTHTGALWTSGGTKLASATFANETASGWQTATFAKPVTITAGTKYVASYLAPKGRYSATNNGFNTALKSGNLTAPIGAGVYTYGTSGALTSSFKNTNYFVDVNFAAQTAAAPAPTPAPTPAPAPTPTPAPPTTPAPGVSATLRQVDGGTGYYGKYSTGLPTDASYFPSAVWFESVLNATDAAKDKSAGINTYVQLTGDSNLSAIADAGMYAIPDRAGSPTAGYMLNDEVDMIHGPEAGYPVMEEAVRRVPAGKMSYANFGKGVTFWETDSEAAKFVGYPNLVSADNYWFTDPNVCGPWEGAKLAGTEGTALTASQCRLAANYGKTVDRVRELVSPVGSKPVWNFVEVGHPFSENDAPTITAPQIKAAVWSGIIHGARGTIYFNHNFGGSCISQHVLRDNCGSSIRPTVAAVNAQVAELAPVLNSPFVDGVLTSTGKVDTAVKKYNGSFYVLAGSARPESQSVTFTNECTAATSATVLGENRTVAVSGGKFTDSFADGTAVHLYQLNGGTCGV